MCMDAGRRSTPFSYPEYEVLVQVYKIRIFSCAYKYAMLRPYIFRI